MQFGVSFPHRRVTLDHGRNGLIERVLGFDATAFDEDQSGAVAILSRTSFLQRDALLT
jgi:hypothetical protein